MLTEWLLVGIVAMTGPLISFTVDKDENGFKMYLSKEECAARAERGFVYEIAQGYPQSATAGYICIPIKTASI